MFEALKRIFCSTETNYNDQEIIPEQELEGHFRIIMKNNLRNVDICFKNKEDVGKYRSDTNRLLLLKKPICLKATSAEDFSKTAYEYILPEEVTSVQLLIPKEWE